MSTDIQKQIEAKKRELAQLENVEYRESLVQTIVKNPKINDKDLYTLAKRFCNRVEKSKRDEKKEE